MSAWTASSAVLVLGILPCAVSVFRGTAPARLVGLEMASVVVSLALVTLSEALGRGPFIDLALALALLSLGGALVFVRTLERWL